MSINPAHGAILRELAQMQATIAYTAPAVNDSHPSQCTVVCPLQFEAKALQRAGLDDNCEIHCCGIGSGAIQAFMTALPQHCRFVVLAGLAGGLDERLEAGCAVVVEHAIDASTGERWSAPVVPERMHFARRVTSISCQGTLISPALKQQCRTGTGADVVDHESAAFAREAVRTGRAWMIVRGVSDDATTTLPRSIDSWVHDDGSTALSSVVLGLMREPWMIGSVIRLGRASRRAMAAVAAGLQTFVLADRPSTLV